MMRSSPPVRIGKLQKHHIWGFHFDNNPSDIIVLLERLFTSCILNFCSYHLFAIFQLLSLWRFLCNFCFEFLFSAPFREKMFLLWNKDWLNQWRLFFIKNKELWANKILHEPDFTNAFAKTCQISPQPWLTYEKSICHFAITLISLVHNHLLISILILFLLGFWNERHIVILPLFIYIQSIPTRFNLITNSFALIFTCLV
jgi:hypothetical protein